MPVTPPNFTQIPNEILDRMSDMTPAEFKVLTAICRKTFGWHKRRDVISLSQLETMTGLSRSAVQSGIMAAIERGMLERKPVGKQSFSYQLVVSDYQSSDTTSSLTLPEPVVSDYQQLVASDYPQKKELNKGNKGGDVRARLNAILGNPDQTAAAVAAAVSSRGEFSLADVDLCERWLDAQRPEWTGKVGGLYKLLKLGNLPTMPRTNGTRTGPAPSVAPDYDMAEVERRTAAYKAANPELDAYIKEIGA